MRQLRFIGEQMHEVYIHINDASLTGYNFNHKETEVDPEDMFHVFGFGVVKSLGGAG